MAKSKERLRALALRREGESIKRIAKNLGVSASAVSSWTRDVLLTEKQRERLDKRRVAAGDRGRMLGTEANRKGKQERIDRARREAEQKIRELSQPELFMLGLGLYWGEGSKASDGTVAIINSDPLIIQLMMRWFRECWDIEPSRFQPRVFISDVHKDREKVITRFWVKTLSIPRQQFRRMIFLNKGKKIYENRDMYYGVLTLRIAKGSELRHRILANIAQVAKKGITPA